MKKRLLLQCFLALLMVCTLHHVHAQEIYASAALPPQREADYYKPLKKVMEELRLQHGIYFMFNNKTIPLKEVDTRVNMMAPVEDVLRLLLTPVGLTFKRVDKIYIIIESNATNIGSKIKEKIINAPIGRNKLSTYLSDTSAAAREATLAEIAAFIISGKVISDTGEPLPGVNVVLRGTNIGTVTDTEGMYKLNAPDGTGTLVFSFIGFLEQEVPVTDRSTIDIKLLPDIRTLGEVVVVGYGVQKRAEVTAAVTSVKAGDFRQSGARNALDLIQGKVAGLAITRTSGTNPNSSPAVQIRGITSITGSLSPLIVIDGIPGGNLDLLQQGDIESIDVLKDGSAAAIYGTQANGGVILITTKKGKTGAPKIDYSTYVRKEYLKRRPKFLTAYEYRAHLVDGSIDGTDYGSSVDAYDGMINHDNLTQYHNVALSGGTENTTYRTSLYYQDQQGIALENERKQYGLRLSLQQRALNNKFTAQVNLATNFNDANLLGGDGWEDQLIRNPTLPIKNPDGTYYFEGTSTNQIARLNQETYKRQQQTSSIDTKATLELLPGLNASVFGSIQRNQYIDADYAIKGSESSVESSTPEGQNGGYAYNGTTFERRYAFEPTLNYAKTIAIKHAVTALAGYSWRYEVNEGFDQSNTGFINDVFQNNNIGSGASLALGRASMSSFKNDNKLIAFFGRINYVFNDKYIAQVILRREGTTRFGKNNKWGMFPAASLGWNISKENFMQGFMFLDDLKLRAGYGVTGNSGIANNASRVTLGTGGNYINPDGVWRQTYGPDRNPNPNLRWEKKEETNIGLDFSLFNSRLSGAIEVYTRKTKDLLDNYTSQLPPFVRESIYTNVGTITSKGLEITLNGVVMNRKGLIWKMDVAASTARNTLTSFSNAVYKADARDFGDIGGFGALGNAIRTFEGGAIGNFYGKRFAGFDEDGQWLFYKRDGSKVHFDEINTSLDPAQSDLAVLGNAVPKYYLSWTNSFTYKGFDLRIYMRGRFGYKTLNTMEISYGNQVSRTNLLRSAFTKHAELKDTYQYSDYYLEPGGFFKLDEVSLGYTFNLPKTYISNLRIYMTGSNLAVFTKYKGNDPDFVNDTGLGPGVDARGAYPSTRSFLVGLNVGF